MEEDNIVNLLDLIFRFKSKEKRVSKYEIGILFSNIHNYN